MAAVFLGWQPHLLTATNARKSAWRGVGQSAWGAPGAIIAWQPALLWGGALEFDAGVLRVVLTGCLIVSN